MNNISSDFIEHLNKEYNLEIDQVVQFHTVYKLLSGKKTYILKRLKNNKLINNYNYLLSQKFNHFLQPLKTSDGKFTTTFKNYSYYLTPYVSNIEYPTDKRLIDFIDLLSHLHKKTNIKRKFHKDLFRRKYQKQVKHLYDRFQMLDYFLVECESSSEKSIFMWYYMINYKDFIYIKNVLMEIQQRIEREVEDIKQFNYSLIHNGPNLDHFLVTNEKNYLISFDNSIVSLKIYDYIKLYIEYCEYQVDWLGLIKQEEITEFEFNYFVFNVIYYIIINMNITKLKLSSPYIAINDLVYNMNVIEKIVKLYKEHKNLMRMSTGQKINQSNNHQVNES